MYVMQKNVVFKDQKSIEMDDWIWNGQFAYIQFEKN